MIQPCPDDCTAIAVLARYSHRQATRYKTSDRLGTLIVCVIVCLLVSVSIAGATTHAALQWRRSLRMEHQLRQTDLLLDAGILRASKQLRRSKEYQGETWRPDRESIGFESPLVEIQVRSGNDPAIRQVEVVAELGAKQNSQSRIRVPTTRRSHQFTVQVTANSQDSTPQVWSNLKCRQTVHSAF